MPKFAMTSRGLKLLVLSLPLARMPSVILAAPLTSAGNFTDTLASKRILSSVATSFGTVISPSFQFAFTEVSSVTAMGFVSALSVTVVVNFNGLTTASPLAISALMSALMVALIGAGRVGSA